jgi:molybdate transport system substrate-binding protein
MFVLLCCAASLSAQITVAAASSMQGALKELGPVFTKETGDMVKLVYGSSGKLMAQIKSGAPFDVFMSADLAFPESLSVAKLTDGKPVPYARGTLVLWTLDTSTNLSDYKKALLASSCRKIAVADPHTAPYGRAAVAFLKSEKLFNSIQKKLVYGDNVSQTAQYLLTGSVDLCITAKSTAMTPEVAGKGRWIELPPDKCPPVDHGMVLLLHAGENSRKAGRAFFDFVLSARGQEILEKAGFSKIK